MYNLAKKEEKATFPVVSRSGACFGFPHPFFAVFYIFLRSLLYKGKTVKKFVNKQLTLAKILSKLSRKKVRVAAMGPSE